jgi:hypothetical protein
MRKVLNNTAAEPPAVVGLVVLSGTVCVDFIVVSDLPERCHRMKSKKRISIFSENGKNHAGASIFSGNGKNHAGASIFSGNGKNHFRALREDARR